VPGTTRGAEKVCALRARPRAPWLTLLAGLFALVASLPEAAPLFEWRRAADPIQIWRPLTGHFAHWSTDHLSWDLLIFAVFGGLLEMRSRASFVAVLATSSAVLGVLLPFVYPDMTAYRGLSGIDCALACAVAVFRMRDPSFADRLSGWAILVFIVSKTGLEWTSAGTLFVDHATAGFEPLPGAHVLGAVVGAGLVAVCTTMEIRVGPTARCPEDAVLAD